MEFLEGMGGTEVSGSWRGANLGGSGVRGEGAGRGRGRRGAGRAEHAAAQPRAEAQCGAPGLPSAAVRET